MILIQAVGGLCNRMLAIDSGIALAKDLEQDLTILWERYPLLNCNYTDLFKSDLSQFNLVERTQKNHFLRQVDKTINFFKFDKFIYTRSFKELRDSKFNFKRLKEYNSIYICGFNRFHGGGLLKNHFIPTPLLQKKIKASTLDFNDDTIGLHLRRTDHEDAINVSSTDKFVSLIKEELKINSNTNFFLATDSFEEEKKLKSLFGKKILSNKRDLSRNSVIGVQDALVDLYCLAATKKIYGSYRSSFSETAAEIGKSELIIVK